jgi:hypothetical protein
MTITTTGPSTASDNTHSGTFGTYAHTAKAPTASPARIRSAADDGSVTAATIATTRAKTGASPRSSSACDHD